MTTLIEITSAVGSTAFDTNTDIVIGGSTTVNAADITGQSSVTVPNTEGTLRVALVGTATTTVANRRKQVARLELFFVVGLVVQVTIATTTSTTTTTASLTTATTTIIRREQESSWLSFS